MDCPYCGKEMQRGEICGETRTKIRWMPENRFHLSSADKLCSEAHYVAALSAPGRFWIQADYCPACRKMIFETDIT